MGAYLSQPKTDKETSSGQNDHFQYGVSCMQGWRMDMEDAHATVLQVDSASNTSFFAVFDGHGGKEVALYAAQHLPRLLRETEGYRAGELGRALTEAYLALDASISRPEEREVLRQLKGSPENSGEAGGEEEGPVPIGALPVHILEALGIKPGEGMAIRIVRSEGGTNELHFGGPLDGVAEEEEEDDEEEDKDKASGTLASPTEDPSGNGPDCSSAEAKIQLAKRKREAAAAAAGVSSPLSSGGDASGSPASDSSRSPFDMKAEEIPEVASGGAPSPHISPTNSGSGGENDWIGPSAGCTAVSALIHDGHLYVANAGDSRCILSRKGNAVALTRDHKPDDPAEFSRILKAGGFVADGRVNGSLNLSRALGDMEYKQSKELGPEEQTVTAVPEIRTMKLQQGDEFLILACDGIWDVLTNQQAVDFTRERLLQGVSPAQICEEMCDHCLAPDTDNCGKGCDNMSVVIVVLRGYGFPQRIERQN